MKPSLLILAAGMGSRYGGLKQVDGVGPNEEAIIEYSIYDAIKAGFGKVVCVIRKDIATAFAEKFGDKFKEHIEVVYAFQELNHPVPGIDAFPEGREKPWGTAHAVLVARDYIQEPFAVINADDYYGVSSFRVMADFLQGECRPDLYSMVGYVLDNTLSDHGTVNRGVCEMDDHFLLTDVVERTKIHREGGNIQFFDESGEKHLLDRSTLVSMNYWGFHPAVFDHLEKAFVAFIQTQGHLPKSELYIPTVMNDLIKRDEAKVKVLTCDAQWYGVTYKEDKSFVVDAFGDMINRGVYPEQLWA